jgi:pimeloyl-ACP methyl ester carboxylesterase
LRRGRADAPLIALTAGRLARHTSSMSPRATLVPVEAGDFIWQGHRLAYEIHGGSGVPCVLLPGLFFDALLNREVARRFAGEGYRVVLLDLLGHGRSDKPIDPREHRIDFCAEQVIALLDHLGIERALVGGLSLGAITALQVAALAEDRCLGLFLEMPVMEWSTTFAALLFVPLIGAVDFAKPVVRAFSRFVSRLPRPRTDSLASVMNVASQPPEVITAVLHGILVGPVVPPARARRAIRLPTLIIGHGGDRLHSLRDAEALAAEMPDAKLLRARSIVELRTAPDRLWPEIAAFLGRVADGASGAAALRAS